MKSEPTINLLLQSYELRRTTKASIELTRTVFGALLYKTTHRRGLRTPTITSRWCCSMNGFTTYIFLYASVDTSTATRLSITSTVLLLITNIAVSSHQCGCISSERSKDRSSCGMFVGVLILLALILFHFI